MKQFLYSAVLLLILPGFFSSCEKIEGQGPILTEIRNHTNFRGLRASVCGKINFQIAPVYHVEVLAQGNILDELITRVDNGDLVLKWDHPLRVRNCEDITINITGPDLEDIYSSGANDIKVRGEVSHRNMEIDLSGSGKVEIQDLRLDNNLKSHVSGSGTIYIDNGSIDDSELYVSGSGEIDLGRVQSNESQAHISGSGTIIVKVKEYLDVRISGSGDVYYIGNPRIDSKISGSGRIKQQ